MGELYITNPAGEEFQIDYLNIKLNEYHGYDRSNKLTFETKHNAPLNAGDWVRWVKNGKTRFRGVTKHPSSKSVSGKLTWECLDNIALMKLRHTFPIRYGAVPVEGAYDGLAIRYVLASDPPIQVGDSLPGGGTATSSDPMTYVPGLLWTMNSLVQMGLSNISIDSDGVWTLSDLGTKFSSGDVYIAGRKCTYISGGYNKTTLTASSFNYQRDSDDLYVYGEGAGDIYGPVFISNAFDYKIRLGNVAREDDYILSALDVGIEPFMPLISDFLVQNGLYMSVREASDYTHLDAGINPVGRGSSDAGFIALKEGDWHKLKSMKVSTPTISALIAIGGSSRGPEAERYVRADFRKGKAWIEDLLERESSQLSPLGTLDEQADNEWTESQSKDTVQVWPKQDLIRPSDWVDIYLPKARPITVQSQEVVTEEGKPTVVKLGGKESSLENAMLEAEESAAIAALEVGALHGEQLDTDTFGNGDTFETSWTPAASEDRDTAKVLFTLEQSSTDTSEFAGLSVTYTVVVNGSTAAILRNRPWGGTMIDQLDITDFCDLDGTLESLIVTVTDPTGTLDESLTCQSTVQGVGRYGPSPAVDPITPQAVVAGTLTLPFDKTTSEEYARYSMSTVGVPNYATRFRLRAYCGSNNPSGKIRLFLKTHGTTYYGSWQSVVHGTTYYYKVSTYGWYEEQWNLNPFTGAAWTQSEIDDIECGIYLYTDEDYFHKPPNRPPSYPYLTAVSTLQGELV